MEDLRVFRVDRVSGKVIKVVIDIYPFRIHFIKIKGKVKKDGEAERLDGVRVYGREQTYVPSAQYNAAAARARAIFSDSKKKKEER